MRGPPSLRACVLDASVAAKWVLPPEHEPHAANAQTLLEQHTRGILQFVVPDLFWPEIGNILWKAARIGRISPATALESLTLLHEVSFRTLPSQPLLNKALSLAIKFDRTVYDCVYVALAIASGATFITADERLANAVRDRLPVSFLAHLT